MPTHDIVFIFGLLAVMAIICLFLIFMNWHLNRKQTRKEQKELEATLAKAPPSEPEPRTSRGYPHVTGTGYTPRPSSYRPRIPTRGSSVTPPMSKNQSAALRRRGVTVSSPRNNRDDDVAYGSGAVVADTYENTGSTYQYSTPSVSHSSSSSSSHSSSSSSCHSSHSHHDSGSSSYDSGGSCDSGGGGDW